MPTYRRRSTVVTATPAQLFDWHGRQGAFHRLNPSFDPVRVLDRSGPGLGVGTTMELETRVGPIPVRWTAEHVACDPPHGFTDVQRGGPFTAWTHHHRFLAPDSGEGAVLEDEIEWAAPLGAIGAAVGGVQGRLERAFEFRHRRTLDDLRRLAPHWERPRMKVAISGASGLVGQALTHFLDAGGHAVVPMVRRRQQAGVYWNTAEQQVDTDALEGVDAVVLLAGESIAAAPWTDDNKARILDSRVRGVDLISRALARLGRAPSVLVSGSAVGVYGDSGDMVVDEGASVSDGTFLGRVGTQWEAAAQPAVDAGIRTVWMRTGIVLSAAGGYLGPMVPLFNAGGGGPQGPGTQAVPWIHLDDLVGLIYEALHDGRYVGPINGTAPTPLPQAEFARTLARVLRRPALVPTPAFALRMALGSHKAEELVLQGQHAVPAKALELGYRFTHPDLESALRFELGRSL